MAFLFQLNPSFPYRSCAKSLEEKERERLQFLAEVRRHRHVPAEATWEQGAWASVMGGKQLQMLLSLLSIEFNP